MGDHDSEVMGVGCIDRDDHYRNNVIPADKLKIMDAATDDLVRSSLRENALREGDRVQDFILSRSE
jgi:hypothetical protein